MKRVALVLMLTLACFATSSFAADKEAIQGNVDEIVAAIDGGKDAASFTPDAYSPYAFIMEQKGDLVVHPSLSGQDLKEKAMPIYLALQGAGSEGKWITYEWKGEQKNTYVKMTKNNLIVGSGY